MQERETNIDVDALAKSPLVRAYMLRIIDDVTDPLTNHVFAATLAQHAADAFDLYYDDSGRFARSLLDVAAHVIALTRACARSGR